MKPYLTVLSDNACYKMHITKIYNSHKPVIEISTCQLSHRYNCIQHCCFVSYLKCNDFWEVNVIHNLSIGIIAYSTPSMCGQAWHIDPLLNRAMHFCPRLKMSRKYCVNHLCVIV